MPLRVKSLSERLIGDLRHAILVQDPLRPQFRAKLVLVEEEDPRDQPQRAHGDVVLAARLHAADGGKTVFVGWHVRPSRRHVVEVILLHFHIISVDFQRVNGENEGKREYATTGLVPVER